MHSKAAYSATPLRLYLLGKFRIENGAQSIALPTRKVESLIAYLIFHPPEISRERLAALFWGDVIDTQARHSLRTALAMLRKTLGDNIIVSSRESVQLDPNYSIWADALVFQSQARAFLSGSPSELSTVNFDLYQGDLLADFYDDWIAPERDTIRTLYLDSLLHLTQHLQSKHDYTAAMQFARRVLVTDPANEKAHHMLMRCQVATGNRIAALKQFDDCTRLLADDLAVEPSSATVALRDQIIAELTGANLAAAPLSNLPVPLTTFIGRGAELSALRGLLARSRLVTVTGTGGGGKTRLAIQFGSELAAGSRFKHGVWWVDLSSLTDPALVATAVAVVFNLRDSDPERTLEVVANYLREKELLLMLDNCEHLIEACARLAEALLLTCPGLHVLATSREALGITGETAWRVPSLACPSVAHLPPPEQIAEYDAIRLFRQRAAAVSSNWNLSGKETVVARICARLDGIPLALELAAARLQGLTIEEIAIRLEDRFQLLTKGSRTALPRQQTLKAMIDWSYDLLSSKERTLFARLAVFDGGWTLAAAEDICAGEGVERTEMLDLMQQLVAKSLVTLTEQDNATRYRYLETIRQYALDKLDRSSEKERLRERHWQFFAGMAEEAEPKFHYGVTDFEWFNRLVLELDNLRTALVFSETQHPPALPSLWLMVILTAMLETRGHLSEARRLCHRLAVLAEALKQPVFQGRALLLAGSITTYQGQYVAAVSVFEKSCDILAGTDDKRMYAAALGFLSRAYRIAGDYARARVLNAQQLALQTASGHKRAIGNALNGEGELERACGNYDTALARYAESLTLFEADHDPRGKAMVLGNQGFVALRLGRNALAAECFLETLKLLQRSGLRLDSVTPLAGLAGVLLSRGELPRAARLLGACEALLKSMDATPYGIDREDYERIVTAAAKHLAQAAFATAWAQGRALSLEQAIQYALEP